MKRSFFSKSINLGFFHPLVFWSRAKRFWPFLIWLAILFAGGYLYFEEMKMGAFLGVVESPREQAAPLETARLNEITVEPAQKVSKGKVLARFDTSLLDGELAMEWLEIERRFSGLVHDVEKELHQARRDYNRDRAELRALEEEIEKLENLLERRLISAEDLTNMRIRKRVLEDAVQTHPITLENLDNQLSLVKEKRDAAMRWLGETARLSALETYDWDSIQVALEVDIESHIERIGLLLQRRKEYTLTARQDGAVSQIYHQPGDVVSSGDPVLSLIVDGSYQILGFLTEARAHDIHVGSEVYFLRRGGDGSMEKATIVALDPEIVHFPEHMSPLPGRPVRGRRVIMRPDEDIVLLPGETVYIHVNRPWWVKLQDRFFSLIHRDDEVS